MMDRFIIRKIIDDESGSKWYCVIDTETECTVTALTQSYRKTELQLRFLDFAYKSLEWANSDSEDVGPHDGFPPRDWRDEEEPYRDCDHYGDDVIDY